MNVIGKFRKAVVKVCAVCIGIIIVDTAYNKGKCDAYKECRDLVMDELDKIESMEEEEAQ